MKEMPDALQKISEIHNQLAKSGVYRGYRSFYVGLSGVIGLVAVALYPVILKRPTPRLFVIYWVAVATVNIFMCAGMIWYQYYFRERSYEQRTTRMMLLQFLPMLAAGPIATFGLYFAGNAAIALLPAIWTLIFGLGVFSLRPYLTNSVIIAGLYYFAASGALFYCASIGVSLRPEPFGLAFGVGQLLSACILYFSIEKANDEKE